MSYKPILFNSEMVRAILDGRKTQTRRIVKPQPKRSDGNWGRLFLPGIRDKQPPYEAGDILWVRETWHRDVGRYMYRANYADDEKFYCNGKEVRLRWSPSIHMPKEAARIFLRVKNVRVERLQNILSCAGEVAKEGIPYDDEGDREASGLRFKELWNSTVKPGDRFRVGWEGNPWVWVIEFERIEKPEGWCS